MRKTSFFKRSLAALLSFVMILGMIPAMNWIAKAAEGDEDTTQPTGPQGNYITLPITVRDFAADGMLFEYNEVDRATFTARNDDGTFTWGNTNKVTITDRLTYNQSGEGVYGTREPFKAVYNPPYWDLDSEAGEQRWENNQIVADYTGIRVYPKDAELFEEADETKVAGVNWYCLIVDANGNILKVLDRTAEKKNINTIMEDEGGAYSVWAWRDPSNLPYYNLLAKVTEENMDQYRVGFYDTVNATLTAGDTLNFYLGIPCTTSTGKDNMGIHFWPGNDTPLGYAAYVWWTRIVCDSSTNQIIDIIPSGTTDDTYGTSDYNIVAVFSGDSASLEVFSHITEDNMSEYQIVVPACDVGEVLFIERTIEFHDANTRGFGLLFTKSSDMFHNLYDDGDGVAEDGEFFIAGSLLEDNDPTLSADGYNKSPYKTVYIWDEKVTEENPKDNHVSQDLYYGTIRTGLVGQKLDEKTNKPVYTQATVDYLADYLQKVMAYGEGYDGVYYSFHVMGIKMFDSSKKYVGPGNPTAVYDLAELIRQQVGEDFSTTTDDAAKLGSYAASKEKFDGKEITNADGTKTIIEPKLRTYQDITTWYDAAYFLLHNTWQDSALDVDEDNNDGYGMPMSNYHSMHLMETTNADGEICYVFNAKYDGTVYNSGVGEIYNTPFVGTGTDGNPMNAENRSYSVAYGKGATTKFTMSGIELPALRFDPLGPASTGGWQGYKEAAVANTYGELNGAAVSQDWSEYYDETNYHMSMEGHAQFVYQYDANQYFTFTGDDDVYLYINGYRVLDIGGAHGIAKVRIDINDVAKKIGLENGKTYSFDFFYLERHGTAANFGIETNIQIADASMNTTKQGFQNGVNTGYGGPVNAVNHVGYTFELENNGTAHIYNLTFNDPNLDVYFGYDKIRPYPLDANGNEVKTNHPYTIEKDLYLIRRNSAGEIVEYLKPGEVTEAILIDRLTKGLAPGETIGIYGIKYKIQSDQWKKVDGAEQFINTVYTTATDDDEIGPTTKTLHGVSDWKVVKMEHPYTAFRVYDWVHKGISNDPAKAETLTWKSPAENGIPVSNSVTVPKADLISKYLLNGENDLNLSDEEKKEVEIVLCTAAGNEDPYFLQGSNAKLDSTTGGITYTSKTVGKDTVFFKFKNVADKAVYDSLVFSFEVYTYGAVDNIYVLDYGLSVELAGETFGFQTNDHLQLNENSREMVPVVTGMVEVVEVTDDEGNVTKVVNNITEKAGTYGDFAYTTTTDDQGNITGRSLKYTPKFIIDNTDTVYAKFLIKEQGTADEDLSIYNSVEMVQKVTTAPASVVYYEENFPGITYCTSANGNNWVQYETTDAAGNPVKGTEQSADQDMNYGSDPNYSDNKGGIDGAKEVIVFTADTSNPNKTQKELIDKLAAFLGLTGEDSNGTYKKLEVTKSETVMSFEFKGTGFEIISRTAQNKYAVVTARIYLLDNSGNIMPNVYGRDDYNPNLPSTGATGLVNAIPVITESVGGDLYQVPIISETGLPKWQYRVELKALYMQDQPSELYIDGIRIYGPLSDKEALEYHNPQESSATFYEVKSLIENFRAIYADIWETTNGEIKMWTAGTLIENTTGVEAVLSTKNKDGSVVELTDYLSCGPNNEIYLDGKNTNGMIAFILTPDEKVDEDQRTIQIGAHRKADAITGGAGYVGMYYGSTVQDLMYEDDISTKPYYIKVSGGTEQYYDIDVNYLKKENGRYMVMIVADSDAKVETLALTTLKVKGYSVHFLEPGLVAANENGTLAEHDIVKAVSEVLGIKLSENGGGNGSGTEDNTDSKNINKDLVINSAGLQSDKVVSRKSATLAVSATTNAASIEVLDAQGDPVTNATVYTTVKEDKVVFTVMWKVTGSSGDKQTYTVRVKDADGNYSANTMTVTVTIK